MDIKDCGRCIECEYYKIRTKPYYDGHCTVPELTMFGEVVYNREESIKESKPEKGNWKHIEDDIGRGKWIRNRKNKDGK